MMTSLVLNIGRNSNPIEIADAFEATSLIAPDQQASQCEMINVIASDLDCMDTDFGEDYEPMFDSAFQVLQERSELLGEGYPFVVEDGVVSLKKDQSTSLYVFLLLLSLLRGKAPNHSEAAKVFEYIAGEAASGYIGGQSLVFGAPRENLPKGFKTALEIIVSKDHLNEGQPSFDDPKTSDQQDAHLDVVAWRHFPDKRPGKIVVFGQCNTGRDGSKSSELNPIKWNKRWLGGSLSPDPIAAYFVPWCVTKRDWRALCSDGGLLFERLRIVNHAHAGITTDVRTRVSVWISEVLAAVA